MTNDSSDRIVMVEDEGEFEICLLPVSTLTVEQLRGLRDLLARYGSTDQPSNLLQVSERFCDEREHVLFRIGHPPVKYICDELQRLGIPYKGF